MFSLFSNPNPVSRGRSPPPQIVLASRGRSPPVQVFRPRCGLRYCTQNHSNHYCNYCGAIDSHFSSRCPNTGPMHCWYGSNCYNMSDEHLSRYYHPHRMMGYHNRSDK